MMDGMQEERGGTHKGRHFEFQSFVRDHLLCAPKLRKIRENGRKYDQIDKITYRMHCSDRM